MPPAHPELVLSGPARDVGEGGRIELSADGGDSWRPAMDGIDAPMPDMVELFVPAPHGTVYAVCSGGRLLRAEPDRPRWRSVLPPGSSHRVRSISFLER